MLVHIRKDSPTRNRVARSRAVAATVVVLLTCPAPAAAAEVMDDLLEKLRARGVLSQAEYEELRSLKAKQAPGNELSSSFRDGFSFQSRDGQHAISLNGRLHADYRAFSNDSGSASSANPASADTFDVRRAYLGISGRLYQDWTFQVNADLAAAPGGVQLDVAWLNYGAFAPAQVRVGQFKMPFSLEDFTSSSVIDFQERGLPNALVPNKERGVMLHGAPLAGVTYGLALSNGQGKNANEPNAAVDDKDLIGRGTVNLAEVLGRKDAVAHFGAGFTTGKLPAAAAPSGRTEARGLTFFTPAAFTGAGSAGMQEMDRKRTGLEALLAWRQFKLQSEWIRASFSGTSNAGAAFDRDIDASYVGFNWLLSGESYADAYGAGVLRPIRPRQAFRTRGGGWGAWDAGVRYSRWDAGDFRTTNPAGTGVLAAGMTNKADAWTLGLKWIPNTNTRVYLNFVKTSFDSPVAVLDGTASDEKAITMRAAFSF